MSSPSPAAPRVPGVQVLAWGEGYDQVLTEQSLTLLADRAGLRAAGPAR